MFISRKKHEAIVAAKNAEISRLILSLDQEIVTNDALDRTAKKFRAERDAARAELAPLKAARERANANLKAANEKRKLAKVA